MPTTARTAPYPRPAHPSSGSSASSASAASVTDAASAKDRDREATERILTRVTDQRPLSRADVDAVVLLNLTLADGIAGRYVGRGIERDDLIQVARLALVKAVHRYRPGRGTSFVGYAAPTISGEIKRHFRDSGWMVRPPRRLQELGAELSQAEENLEQQLHRRPSSSELAAALGVHKAQIRAARKAAPCYRALSIDAMADTHYCPELADPAADTSFDDVDTAQSLRSGLDGLSSRESFVLRLRFVESRTQSEIAERIGVSQMQVSRILSRTLLRLRSHMKTTMAA